MQAEDYQVIFQHLQADCRRAIQEFAESPENRDVYAFCIYCDPENPENADYHVCLNTEGAFRRRVQERYRDRPAQELVGFQGVRFNPADFGFFDIGSQSAPLYAACGRYRAYLDSLDIDGQDDAVADRRMDLFVEQAVRVIEQLDDAFALLARTADFVAYVSLHDVDESTLIALCRRTVPAEVFARAFLDVMTREHLHERLAQQPIEEQVAFWARTFEALALRQEPPRQVQEAIGFHEFDALDALKALGPPAVSTMLDLIERYAGYPEFTVPGSQEFDEVGAFTREAWLTHDLLLALIDIGYADDHVHQRLADLLHRVYAANRTKATSGLHPSLSARALHRLFPARYPAPQVSDSTNHLLNATAFGLE